MQPLIGITTGEVINRDYPWTPPTYGQMHTYTDAIVRVGGVPLLVPIVPEKSVLKRLYDLCDGILFSGGNDLNPITYGDELSPQTQSIAPKRDEQELQLLKWALRDDKPMLGICRGMQLINVGLGGSLYQDVAASLASASDHQHSVKYEDFKQLAHHLQINSGSRLAEILDVDHIDTNSLHHQAIKEVGKGLVVTAHSDDGVIEAIELPDKRFLIGIQSHPEALEAETERRWQKLFAEFVQACADAVSR